MPLIPDRRTPVWAKVINLPDGTEGCSVEFKQDGMRRTYHGSDWNWWLLQSPGGSVEDEDMIRWLQNKERELKEPAR